VAEAQSRYSSLVPTGADDTPYHLTPRLGVRALPGGEPPRRALREQPTARAAVHAMLRATADQITGPDTPHYCMLILAAPTDAVENHAVREFLADRRPDQHTTIEDRLARGVTDGDLTAPPASLDAIARYYTTVVQGLSIQVRDGATRADLEAVITCAMAAWDTLTCAPSHTGGRVMFGGSGTRGRRRETGHEKADELVLRGAMCPSPVGTVASPGRIPLPALVHRPGRRTRCRARWRRRAR
jgi:hypothetical protein